MGKTESKGNVTRVIEDFAKRTSPTALQMYRSSDGAFDAGDVHSYAMTDFGSQYNEEEATKKIEKVLEALSEEGLDLDQSRFLRTVQELITFTKDISDKPVSSEDSLSLFKIILINPLDNMAVEGIDNPTIDSYLTTEETYNSTAKLLLDSGRSLTLQRIEVRKDAPDLLTPAFVIPHKDNPNNVALVLIGTFTQIKQYPRKT